MDLRRGPSIPKLDWLTVLLYCILIIWGWLNIYATEYDASLDQSLFDLSMKSGMQLLWISASALTIFLIMLIDYRFFESVPFFIYVGIILLLIIVLFFGQEVAGSKSWLVIGGIRLQPAEFAKFATALALASFISRPGMRVQDIKTQIVALGIIALPAGLILYQNDTGSSMVFCIFLVVLYREGMSPLIILLGLLLITLFVLTLFVEQIYLMVGTGVFALFLIFFIRKKVKYIMGILAGAVLVIGFLKSIDYVLHDVLQPHQQNRIKALVNPGQDPSGYGWNVIQSKIAIGSGGITGKGFLQGTQTKYDFVPEQHTDFIFCTIGEEYGWIGSSILIILFVTLLSRLLWLAEKQKSRFARVYGYCVVMVFFFHFIVNIGMTIGLFPVIGIPLPFFSYGGSSLLSFTVLLFIFLNLDASKGDLMW